MSNRTILLIILLPNLETQAGKRINYHSTRQTLIFIQQKIKTYIVYAKKKQFVTCRNFFALSCKILINLTNLFNYDNWFLHIITVQNRIQYNLQHLFRVFVINIFKFTNSRSVIFENQTCCTRCKGSIFNLQKEKFPSKKFLNSVKTYYFSLSF